MFLYLHKINIFVDTHLCIYMHMCVSTKIFILCKYKNMSLNMINVFKYIYIYVYIYVYIYICICIYVCVCIYACVCVCACAYMCVAYTCDIASRYIHV